MTAVFFFIKYGDILFLYMKDRFILKLFEIKNAVISQT